jgi:hypothetical protein
MTKEFPATHRRENSPYRSNDMLYQCLECNLSFKHNALPGHIEKVQRRGNEVRNFAEAAGLLAPGEIAPIFPERVKAVAGAKERGVTGPTKVVTE